jgi:hypothetical protein
MAAMDARSVMLAERPITGPQADMSRSSDANPLAMFGDELIDGGLKSGAFVHTRNGRPLAG